ncbi:PIN domain-containing protein [Sphingomonas sp. MMS24-JH45]
MPDSALPARPALSIVTLAELEGGVSIAPALTAARRKATDALAATLAVLALDREVVAIYGGIVAACGFHRRRVLDRLIAATAIVHDLALITINGDDFRDIPGLSLEVWSGQIRDTRTFALCRPSVEIDDSSDSQRVTWNSTRVAE